MYINLVLDTESPATPSHCMSTPGKNPDATCCILGSVAGYCVSFFVLDYIAGLVFWCTLADRSHGTYCGVFTPEAIFAALFVGLFAIVGLMFLLLVGCGAVVLLMACLEAWNALPERHEYDQLIPDNSPTERPVA